MIVLKARLQYLPTGRSSAKSSTLHDTRAIILLESPRQKYCYMGWGYIYMKFKSSRNLESYSEIWKFGNLFRNLEIYAVYPNFEISSKKFSSEGPPACNGFCLLRHTKAWLARDIISLIRDIISLIQWHDVFTCTLLHRELRDYSLGQIAFVFFEGYLLSHSCFVM